MIRLFIDPAVNKSGWAIFREKRKLASGHYTASGETARKLMRIGKYYKQLAYKYEVDEVHIENVMPSPNMGRTKKMFPLYYSMGVIMARIAELDIPIYIDLQVKSWQKYVDWKGKRKPLKKYKTNSEDELAALGMALWYVNKDDK